MPQKKAVISLVTFLLVSMLLIGGLSMAAELGTKDDPIVTVSYILQTLQPTLLEAIDAAIAETAADYEKRIDTRYNEFSRDLDEKILAFEQTYTGDFNDDAFVEKVANSVVEKTGGPQAGGAPVASGAVSGAAGFTRVEIPQGKKIVFKEGAMFVPRLGTGKVTAPKAPGFINITTAGSVNDGGGLTASNLYLCTIDGNGIAASDKMTIFVMGTYTIS